jgi:predicted HTH domain antitoxin
MTIEISPEIAELLATPNRPVDQAVNEIIVLELYRQHEISVGRAAELLHMPLADFMKYSSDRGIPLVDMTEEEIARELETIRQFASRRG